jgi:hypothetical protein
VLGGHHRVVGGGEEVHLGHRLEEVALLEHVPDLGQKKKYLGKKKNIWGRNKFG